MMVSLESETGCWKVHVNKPHLCHYCFSNFPPVGAFLGWGSLKQVLGSLRGDNKAEEGRKLGGTLRASSPTLLFISLVI